MLDRLREAHRVYRSIVDNPAIAGHRAQTLIRAFRWQFAKRTGARRAIVTVGPARIYCYPQSTGASSVIYGGLYDWDEMTFMLRYLRPGDHFVDVGANIGAYSVFAAAFVGDLQVTAFEPDGLARERLHENFALNGIVGATVSDNVVGDHVGEITFSSGRDALNSIVEPSEPDTVTLPMTTIDSVLSHTPAVMKIDVEGAEQEVLKGASEILSADEPPALILELNGLCERFGASPASMRALLAKFDFALYEYDGDSNRLTRFESDGYPAGRNVIALSTAQATQARIKAMRATDEYRVAIDLQIERS